MLLKRHYKKPDGWEKTVDAAGTCTNPPPLDFIECKHTGSSAAQHFSTRLVTDGLSEGWMSIKDGKLTLHCQPDDLVYQIVRVPGKYPSKTEKSGHEVINYYDCVLDAKQHEKFSAQALKARLLAMTEEVAHG